eukprot:403332072
MTPVYPAHSLIKIQNHEPSQAYHYLKHQVTSQKSNIFSVKLANMCDNTVFFSLYKVSQKKRFIKLSGMGKLCELFDDDQRRRISSI